MSWDCSWRQWRCQMTGCRLAGCSTPPAPSPGDIIYYVFVEYAKDPKYLAAFHRRKNTKRLPLRAEKKHTKRLCVWATGPAGLCRCDRQTDRQTASESSRYEAAVALSWELRPSVFRLVFLVVCSTGSNVPGRRQLMPFSGHGGGGRAPLIARVPCGR